MKVICDRDSCSGCYACINICPKNAISMVEDECGKTITDIDIKKCICCNACYKVCPSNNMPRTYRSNYAYAVWSKEKQDIELSSSGGASAVFSRKIVNCGGSVFGATFIDNIVRHVKVETEELIDVLRGSKYVQSQIGNCYKNVKKDLQSDRWVLFTGTPCQVAGLINYLGKDYSKLITVDLVCHGTPPIRYLSEYIQDIIGKRAKWDRVAFRGKDDFCFTIYAENNIIYQSKADDDLYYQSFVNSLTYRENCYKCKYARPDRVSDITIGDFWGLDKTKLDREYNGKVSLVLTNTEKGNEFFENCKELFYWERRELCEALNPEQGNLIHPSTKHVNREQFLENYKKKGFTKSVKKTKIGKQIRNEKIKLLLKKTNLFFFYRVAKKLIK